MSPVRLGLVVLLGRMRVSCDFAAVFGTFVASLVRCLLACQTFVVMFMSPFAPVPVQKATIETLAARRITAQLPSIG